MTKLKWTTGNSVDLWKLPLQVLHISLEHTTGEIIGFFMVE